MVTQQWAIPAGRNGRATQAESGMPLNDPPKHAEKIDRDGLESLALRHTTGCAAFLRAAQIPWLLPLLPGEVISKHLLGTWP